MLPCKACISYGLVVKVDWAKNHCYKVFPLKLFFQILLQLFGNYRSIRITGRNLQGLQVGWNVPGSVVCSQKDCIIPFPYVFVKKLQQSGNISVKAQIGILDFLGIHSENMSHFIGASETEGKHIGEFILP